VVAHADLPWNGLGRNRADNAQVRVPVGRAEVAGAGRHAVGVVAGAVARIAEVSDHHVEPRPQPGDDLRYRQAALVAGRLVADHGEAEVARAGGSGGERGVGAPVHPVVAHRVVVRGVREQARQQRIAVHGVLSRLPADRRYRDCAGERGVLDPAVAPVETPADLRSRDTRRGAAGRAGRPRDVHLPHGVGAVGDPLRRRRGGRGGGGLAPEERARGGSEAQDARTLQHGAPTVPRLQVVVHLLHGHVFDELLGDLAVRGFHGKRP
jgi:hypothetical protein